MAKTFDFEDFSELENLNKVYTILDETEEKLKKLGVERVWTVYGWPTTVGRLMGFCKTIEQNHLKVSDEIFKFSHITYLDSGIIPFSKNGKVSMKDPNFKRLQQGLWYIAKGLGIEKELLEDIKKVTPETWERIKSRALDRIEENKASEEAEKELETTACPF